MSPTEIRHLNMVATLVKPGEAIVGSLTPENAHLWHMATGVAGEAGELLDAIKKVVVYQKEPDIKNIIEELGDLEFYMGALRTALNLNRDDILEANIGKLGRRYEGHRYSDDAAQARADKTT